MINQRPIKFRLPSSISSSPLSNSSSSSSSSTTSSSFPLSSSSTPSLLNNAHHNKSDQTLTLTLTKMSRRSLLKPTLITSLFIFSIYAFFHHPLQFLPNSTTLQIPNSSSQSQQSVRVYMYDLPKKFTHGVIESYSLSRGNDDVTTKSKYPGNQHMAEWYLFSDLNDPKRSGIYVTRVLDPDDAELFYVPFFSSLSLVANPARGGVVAKGYSDEEMQEELVMWLEKQVYWRRNGGRDHVFVCQDPNALYKVIDRVKSGVLLVSDFGRLGGRDRASLVKDVILPYSHRINSYKGEVGVEHRKSLMFFMGNRYRKEVWS